jgi:arylsulfatase A-like enzyme
MAITLLQLENMVLRQMKMQQMQDRLTDGSTGKGFDHFYGFLGSQTDQYNPDLVEDQVHIKPDGRHLNELITEVQPARFKNSKSGTRKTIFLVLCTWSGSCTSSSC